MSVGHKREPKLPDRQISTERDTFLGRRDNTWACPDLPSERTAELVGLRHVPTQHASEISRSSAGAINNWILTTTMRWVIALGAPVATFHSCHFMAASSSRCALAMHESFNLVNVYKNVLNEIDRQWRQIRSVYSFKCVQWITDPKSSCLAKCSSQNSKRKLDFFHMIMAHIFRQLQQKFLYRGAISWRHIFVSVRLFTTCLSENLVQTVYRRILSNSTRKLLWFEITKMLIAVLKINLL